MRRLVVVRFEPVDPVEGLLLELAEAMDLEASRHAKVGMWALDHGMSGRVSAAVSVTWGRAAAMARGAAAGRGAGR